eukprot:539633_1
MSDDFWFFPDSQAVNDFTSTSAFIALTHNVGLLLFVCYKNKTNGVELSNLPSLMKPLYIITFVTLFGFIFYNITSVFVAVQPIYEALTCENTMILVTIAYSLQRYTLWLFSLTRIHVLFCVESIKSMGYSPKTLKIIFVILTVCFMQHVSFILTATSGAEVFIDKNTSFCGYIFHSILMIYYAALVDNSCTIGCFLLFFKKMKMINNLEKSFGKDSAEIKYVLRKCTILLATNIVTSWITVFFVTFTPMGTGMGQWDSIINMWTIVLFDVKYHKIYNVIFGCIAKPSIKQTAEATLAAHMGDNSEAVGNSRNTTTTIDAGIKSVTTITSMDNSSKGASEQTKDSQ